MTITGAAKSSGGVTDPTALGRGISSPWRSWLRLVRPANLVTAAADVLAGFGLAHLGRASALPWLVAATVCLYAGGVTLNDVFDADLDATERPERPIPSGLVSRRSAAAAGAALLLLGVALAAFASVASSVLAGSIALLALTYDGWAKPRRWLGPLCMAGCRGLNLLLGVSAVPAVLLSPRSGAALVSTAYIGAITLVSHGEVSGATRRSLVAPALCLGVAGIGVVGLSLSSPPGSSAALVFAGILAWRLFTPAVGAWRDPSPASIMTMVRAGVVNLILLDAALAAIGTGLLYPLLLVALFLPAGLLSRVFAVT